MVLYNKTFNIGGAGGRKTIIQVEFLSVFYKRDFFFDIPARKQIRTFDPVFQ